MTTSYRTMDTNGLITLHDGTRNWTVNGQLHRVGGPAIEHPNGSTEWFEYGIRHRTDGPAIDHPCGTREWYQNGVLHRIGGPAFEHALDRGADWYKDGKRHRIGGPAREYRSTLGARAEYWVNDRRFTEEEYYRYVDQITGEVFVPPGKRLLFSEYSHYVLDYIHDL